MRRFRLIALLALSVAIAAAIFGYWAIATSQGSRWLLETFPRAVGADLSIEQIEGRILDRLSLSGLRLTLNRRTVEIDRLELQWLPRRLLAGNIVIDDLLLAGVRIQDDTPQDNKPTVLSWPGLSRNLQRLDATVTRLQLTDLSYRRLQEQTLRISSLRGSFTWYDGVLSGEEFALESPGGAASGRLAAGFGKPSLTGKLLLLPATPLWSMDQLTILLEPGQGTNTGLTTRIILSASAGGQQVLTLSGEAGLADGRLTLSQARLTGPDHQGEISGDGTVTVSGDELLMDFRLALDGLNLSPPLRQATNLSGTLSLSGTPEQYRGKLNLANQGPGWQAASIDASFQGDSGKIALPQLSARILDGTVSGNLTYSWSNGSLLTGDLTARNLDPSRLDPRWQGVVNAVAKGTLRWDGDQPVRGTIRGELLQSELHGRSLSGALHAELTDAGMLVKMLRLQGKGFVLHGSGNLQQRLNLVADIRELGQLVPNASGTVKGDGWIRLRNGKLSGAARATSARLSIGEITVSSAQLTARLAEGAAYPFNLALSLRDLTGGGQTVQAAELAVHGTLPRHDLSLALRSEQARAQLRLTAGYRSGVWQGVITSLTGTDRLEPWKMTRPASFAVSSKRIRLDSLQLASGGAEKLDFTADVMLSPLQGSIRTNWQALNLARFNQFLATGALQGTSQGNLSVEFNKNRLKIAGNGSAEGSFRGEKGTVAIDSATVAISGDENGVHADAALATAGGGSVTLTLASPEPLQLAVPKKGSFSAQVSRFDSAQLAPWFPEGTSLTGEITAALEGALLPGRRFTFSGDGTLSNGAVISGDQSIPFTSAAASWNWHDRSLAGKLALATVDYGRLSGTVEGGDNGVRASLIVQAGDRGSAVLQFTSPDPLALKIPGQGTFNAALQELDSSLADRWLPEGFSLQGKVNGTLEGKLLPGERFTMTGSCAVADGTVQHRQDSGTMNVSFSSAAVRWDWQGQALSGSLLLATADHGQLNGTFLLPLPATLPLAFDRSRELSATLHGSLREQGLVAALFPDAVLESSGELAVALELLGTADAPRLEGTLELNRASAYLPGSGIRLKDIRVAAHLAPDTVVIDSFRAVSGPGYLEGNAVIDLKGGEVSGYRGSVKGDNFLAVNFPELVLHGTPDFTFSGDRQKVTIRGDLLLPEVHFESTSSRTLVVASSDVILEGRTEPLPKRATLSMNGQIRLKMGDKVFVKLDGIDTRLAGSLELTFDRIDNIISSGEIRLLDGRYRTYGVNLAIQRGRIFFAGGPLNSPTLDILAIRRIGAVKAGVTVTGRLQKPIVRLYSEPAMPDVDILAYIVLGHPLGSPGQQASLMARAAGALLTSGQAAEMQNKIKQKLGFSTLEIQSGVASQTSTSSYQPMTLSNGSGTPAGQEPGVTETVLTVGKYLTPELYVSYGKSLFSNSNLFKLRYDITKKWQIESQTGSESGVDLYYKIEFGAR